MLISHVNRLRSLKDFERATIVFVPESNLGYEGWHLGELLLSPQYGLRNICVMKEDRKEEAYRPGIRISSILKERLTWMLEQKFSESSMYLYEHFFTVSYDKPEKMLDEMECQLLNYARIKQTKKNVHSPPTIHYGGKSGYGYDDVVCAWYLLLLARNIFYTKPEYEKWRL